MGQLDDVRADLVNVAVESSMVVEILGGLPELRCRCRSGVIHVGIVAAYITTNRIQGMSVVE